jgi:hypothetical protein
MAVARPVPIPAIGRPGAKTQAAPLAHVQAEPLGRFRRCTFRRIDTPHVGRALTVYQVDCLYPDRATPLSLGDLSSAHGVCAACSNPGIFRPDAD